MTEEQKQDWKEAMIGKYAQLVKVATYDEKQSIAIKIVEDE